MSIVERERVASQEVDWKAATDVADALGRRTLRLVSERDPEAIVEWALEMARTSSVSSYSAPRVASYLELAVLVGYAPAPPDRPPERDKWIEWFESRIAYLESQIGALTSFVDTMAREAEAKAEAVDEEGVNE
jgi:hypothetical protein